MPNVPNVPGVPPLGSYAAEVLSLLIEDSLDVLLGETDSQWGVFGADGGPAFEYDSVAGFEYKKNASVADYPIEGGSFQSYNKVEYPFDVRVRLIAAATAQDRRSFVADIRAAAVSLDLFDVVTPEGYFLNCNISHVDYRQTADRGVGMIVADVWFVEIKESATTTFTQTKQPESQARQNIGVQQPQEQKQSSGEAATFSQRYGEWK